MAKLQGRNSHPPGAPSRTISATATESGLALGTSQNMRGRSWWSVLTKPWARFECSPFVPVPTVRMRREDTELVNLGAGLHHAIQ